MSSGEFERDLIARGFRSQEAMARRADFDAWRTELIAEYRLLEKRLDKLTDAVMSMMPQPKSPALEGRGPTESAETVVAEDALEVSSLKAGGL